MLSDQIIISEERFQKRWETFAETWKSNYNNINSTWSKVQAVVVLTGKQSDDTQISRAGIFHLWLFGYIMTEMMLVALKSGKVFFLTGQKKLRYIEQLHKSNHVLLKKETNEENIRHLNTVISEIKQMCQQEQTEIKLASIYEDSDLKSSSFTESIINYFNEQLQFSDKVISLNAPLSILMSLQDSLAKEATEKAGILAAVLMQVVLINKVETILNDELNMSHKAIVEEIEASLDNKKTQEKWLKKYKLEPYHVDFVYAIVQSGERQKLKQSQVPTSENLSLQPGTITLAVGSKYKDYCSNIACTLLFNANKEQRYTYLFAYEVLKYAIAQCIPGKTFNDIFDSIVLYVKERRPNLFTYMIQNFGHCLGLEFRNSLTVLNGKCTMTLQEGMVLNINVAFENIEQNGEMEQNNKPYSVWLADTVEICSDQPKILTANVSKKLDNINYEIVEESTQILNDSCSTSDNKPQRERSPIMLRDRLQSRNKSFSVEDYENILKTQRILRQKKLEELKQRYENNDLAFAKVEKKAVKKFQALEAYKSTLEFPRDLKTNYIYLDPVRESIIVPIPNFGFIPLHLAMVQNIICQIEDNKKHYTVRIQFHVPANLGTKKAQEGTPFPNLEGPNIMYIKELIFRSTHSQLPQLCKSAKELQKHMKQQEESKNALFEKSQADTHFELTKSLNPVKTLLRNVMVKAGVNMRRTFGVLEAHMNGFRYSGSRIETIDFPYASIKHAFFQPCENEHVVLIHFHLSNPIFVNKRKTYDIQFYTEIGNQTDDLDQRRMIRDARDPDEIYEELREREMKKQLNREFRKFVEEVEQFVRKVCPSFQFSFDIPIRDLSFYGVPKASNQLMIPTAHCLVQLSEWPVFVLSLNEIEIVSFERVYHGLRNFDMIFILKDYSKPVRQITTIPVKSLDMIKRWLNEIDIVWYESKGNLNWSEVLKTIREDIEEFVKEGGFGMFLDDLAEEKKEIAESTDETDTDDEDYEEEVTESSETGSDESVVNEDESEKEDFSENSENSTYNESGTDDEGLTWEELEKKAIQEDRKRNRKAVETDTLNKKSKAH